MLPSLIHDWMYYNHQADRDITDDLFFTLLKNNGVSNFMANLMWGAVKAGGEFVWDNDEEDIEMLTELCRKVFGRPNFEGYKFPRGIVDRIAPSAQPADDPE